MKDNGAPVVLSEIATRNGYGDEVITPSDRNGEKFGQTILTASIVQWIGHIPSKDSIGVRVPVGVQQLPRWWNGRHACFRHKILRVRIPLGVPRLIRYHF